MADYGIYWKNFARESNQGDWPCTRWWTNSDRLGRCANGGRLWLFTSGVKCGMADEKAAYLVELFTVDEVETDRGGDSGYPAEEFRFLIRGREARCVAVHPPLSVDDVLRPPEYPVTLPVGTILQSPRKLREDVLLRLVERPRSERPDLWQQLGGEP